MSQIHGRENALKMNYQLCSCARWDRRMLGGILQRVLQSQPLLVASVRNGSYAYRNNFPVPKETKRIKTYGWQKRISTPAGRRILMRRILKGRWILSHWTRCIFIHSSFHLSESSLLLGMFDDLFDDGESFPSSDGVHVPGSPILWICFLSEVHVLLFSARDPVWIHIHYLRNPEHICRSAIGNMYAAVNNNNYAFS